MAKLICFGHRGAAGHAPENTLPSVKKALELGADWIEIDAYLVEGELIVFHDDRLERTTNGAGYLTEKSLEYLRSLDAGNGEKIPLLREVFDLVNRRAGINIELKGPETAGPVAKLIENYVKNLGWRYEEILVSSFNHHELRKIKELQPSIRTGALIVALPLDYAAFAEELGAYSVHPGMEFINREFVNDAHRRNLKVFVFTVNHPDDLRKMKALGVDGVFTDYPEIVKK
jgi:glycerophosphoryl diester phosphodiesterase